MFGVLFRMKQMRPRRRLSSGKLRMMRIVAGRARLERHCARIRIPIAARASMHTSFPIAKGRTMTASAQRRTVRDGQFTPIARLERVEFCFVMAIEADVIAAMRAVAHHDVLVLGGNDNRPVRVEPDRWRFALLVASVAVEIGQIRCRRREDLRCRNPGRRIAEKVGVQ